MFLVTYDISEEFWSNGLIHIADIDCHLSREFTCLLCRTHNPAKNENVIYSFSFFSSHFLSYQQVNLVVKWCLRGIKGYNQVILYNKLQIKLDWAVNGAPSPIPTL